MTHVKLNLVLNNQADSHHRLASLPPNLPDQSGITTPVTIASRFTQHTPLPARQQRHTVQVRFPVRNTPLRLSRNYRIKSHTRRFSRLTKCQLPISVIGEIDGYKVRLCIQALLSFNVETTTLFCN